MKGFVPTKALLGIHVPMSRHSLVPSLAYRIITGLLPGQHEQTAFRSIAQQSHLRIQVNNKSNLVASV
jgi:hypothetical protein